jgi:CSLREA domain-containing protein
MMRLTHNRVAGIRVLALGVLLAMVMAAGMVLAAQSAHAATTFHVNSTVDHADANPFDGFCDTGDTVTGAGGEPEAECTLRAAIAQANHTAGADTINFAIPGTGVKTIAPESPLPPITEAVTINGYSQPGARPNTRAVGSDAALKIELSGASSPGAVGLFIGASNSTFWGLVVNRWDRLAIHNSGPDATGNRVAGNYIGTDASGTQDLGNRESGVYLGVASNNTVGGTTPGARNVISGNTYEGVAIAGPNARSNKVTGNYVGTDKSGTAPLGNGDSGVYIYDAPNNTVGGTTARSRNVISGNERNGVVVYGDTATGNRILPNSIFANGLLGIDLGDDGPTANDPKDPDVGSNYLQNKPVLSSAKKGATGTTTVRGTLNSTPGKTFTVQFFSNPSGADEGRTLLGSKSVTTTGTGNVSFSFSTQKAIRLGQNITATATGPGGNTSEFSAPRKVVAQ